MEKSLEYKCLTLLTKVKSYYLCFNLIIWIKKHINHFFYSRIVLFGLKFLLGIKISPCLFSRETRKKSELKDKIVCSNVVLETEPRLQHTPTIYDTRIKQDPAKVKAICKLLLRFFLINLSPPPLLVILMPQGFIYLVELYRGCIAYYLFPNLQTFVLFIKLMKNRWNTQRKRKARKFVKGKKKDDGMIMEKEAKNGHFN